MKNIIKNLSLVLLIGGMASCSDFDDINENPNEPIAVGTETLLASSQRSVSSVVGSYFGVLYTQQMSQITYTEDSRYGATRADFNGWYSGPLANLEKIISLNTDEATKGDVLSGGSNANQIGVARIMKAYFFNHMVERWGPIPYSGALAGSENLLPAYDTEESIYQDLFVELKEAAAQLDGGSIEGDILLGGDTGEWKKFANTLRAKMAIRIADADGALAKAEFLDASGAGLLSGSLMYDYLGEAANQNPWFERFITRTDYAISNIMVDFLTATNDPRLASFADPASSTGTIQGMPYGLEDSEVMPTDVSFPNSTYIKAQDSDIPVISMSQINFMLAEAAARGWTSDDAATHYNAAIAASMNRWGISDTDAIDAFTAQSNVAYDAANWKKSIGEQEWVSLFAQGYESWAEWRRLDFPQLAVAESPLNPSEGIPLRNMYPNSEATLNTINYDAAVAQLSGGDSDGVKLWWDKF